MNSEELASLVLPCPFCGSKKCNTIEYKEGYFSLTHWCESGLSPSNVVFYGGTEESVIAAWNKRAEVKR